MSDWSNSVTSDVSGNVYVVGYFASPTIIFENITLTNDSTNGYPSIYLAKYDANGNVLWAKNIGGVCAEFSNSISTDAIGNVYVSGTFSCRTIIFGSDTLTNIYSYASEIFLAKYDATGSLIWVKNADGIGQVKSISTDSSGNTYLAGWFSNNIAFGSVNLTSISLDTFDIFLAKYDANGNVLWANRYGGKDGDGATSISTDNSGNVIMTGFYYSDTIKFGSTNLPYIYGGWNPIFVAKFDSNGNPLWAKNVGVVFENGLSSVASDHSGNVYVVRSDYDSSYFTKYNPLGNIIWEIKVAGCSATSVTMDMFDNIIIVGYFVNATCIFGTDTLTPVSGSDIFIVKYDSNGNIIWASKVAGINLDYATSVTTDASNNIFVTGAFSSPTLAFGSNLLTNSNYNNGSNDYIFLAKISGITGIKDLPQFINSISIYPNPATSIFTIHRSQPGVFIGQVIVSDVCGRVIHTQPLAATDTQVDASKWMAGIYLCEIRSPEGSLWKKISVLK